MQIKAKNNVESLSWRLCAYRLDPNVSAAEFVWTLDTLIEAVRKDERGKAATPSVGA
jgi:hypothetical protein